MIARLLILIARGWQLGPSRVLPPTCRYAPSCSAYAIGALQKHGAIKGDGWRRNGYCAATRGAGMDMIRSRNHMRRSLNPINRPERPNPRGR